MGDTKFVTPLHHQMTPLSCTTASPRCCTTHHILRVGLSGSSKWFRCCTTTSSPHSQVPTLPLCPATQKSQRQVACLSLPRVSLAGPSPSQRSSRSAFRKSSGWIRQTGSTLSTSADFPKAGSDLSPPPPAVQKDSGMIPLDSTFLLPVLATIAKDNSFTFSQVDSRRRLLGHLNHECHVSPRSAVNDRWLSVRGTFSFRHRVSRSYPPFPATRDG
ncbi:hypothetical protein V8E51_017366 [Hyaloscypha variabilis]